MISTGIHVDFLVNGRDVSLPELDIRTEWLDVTSIDNTRPDHTWRINDKEGHFHAYDKEGRTPTLKAVYDPGEDEEDEVFSHYACRICDEPIQPRTVPALPGQTRVAGRRSWEGSFKMGYGNPYFREGDTISIHIPRMNRFGLAMINGSSDSLGFLPSYTFVGVGELHEYLP